MEEAGESLAIEYNCTTARLFYRTSLVLLQVDHVEYVNIYPF